MIAGNRTERRVERLREFWEVITKPPIGIPGARYFAAIWNGSGEGHWTNRLSALTSMLYGVPEFFAPRPFPPLMSVAESSSFVSYYDTTPLQATLTRLADFGLINTKSIRLSVAATNARTEAPVYFDNREHPITSAHIMASASVPPSFPCRPRSMANIIGTAPGVELADAIRHRRCLAQYDASFSKSISGMATAKFRSTFRRPTRGALKSTALRG